MVRSLITGIGGFVASHMADRLLLKGKEVYGTKRFRSDLTNLEHIKDKINFVEADMLDAKSLEEAIKKVKPTHIYHLAANSYVPDSWSQPTHTITTNTIGTANLLEAVRKYAPNARVLIAGTSEEYGFVKPDECPITEDQPLRPMSPYGVSKVGADLIARQYHRSYGLDVIVARAFNHTGPRRHESFVIPTFAKQVVEAGMNQVDYPIKVGNLEAVRDFTDVRDTVAAYELALEKGTAGEVYNIATGEGHPMREILTRLIGLNEGQSNTYKLIEDPSRMRPSDVPLLIGDSTKFREATGWKPVIPLTRTLLDTLNYWRENIKK